MSAWLSGELIFAGLRPKIICGAFSILIKNSSLVAPWPVFPPSGATVPLDEFVHFEEIIGARQITREFNQRFVTVQCNARGLDIGTFVVEAEERICEEVDLPAIYKWFAGDLQKDLRG